MPNAMERYSTSAAITVGKSFCRIPPVLWRTTNLDAAADNFRIGSHCMILPLIKNQLSGEQLVLHHA
jgi:hypothetical protein